MEAVELKLKQASAVLGVAPKDLQNLVHFKVLRPSRRDSIYRFDNRLLLEAKIALYLKDMEPQRTCSGSLRVPCRVSVTSMCPRLDIFRCDLARRKAESQSRFEFPSEIWRTS